MSEEDKEIKETRGMYYVKTIDAMPKSAASDERDGYAIRVEEEGSFARESRDGRGFASASVATWFQPGHTLQPAPHQRAENKAREYRAAIVNNVPPERIVSWLNKAAEMAEKNRSWRGMLEVAQVALTFGIGKPRAQSDDSGSVDLSGLLATIRGLADAEGVRGETKETGEGEAE